MGLGLIGSRCHHAGGRYRTLWDFSGLSPGGNSPLAGLSYSCTSNSRYVQNSTSAGDLLISGIGQDLMPIGRWRSDLLYGLSLDPASTNLIASPRDQSGWGAASPGVGGSHTKTEVGVDGTANQAWYSNIATVGDYSAYYQGFSHGTTSWVSDYVRCPTASVGASNSRIRPYRLTTGATSYLGSSDAAGAGRALTDRWVAQRRYIADASGLTAGYLACVSGVRVGQYGTAMAPRNIQITDCPQWTAQKYPTEFHTGTRNAATLSVDSSRLLSSSGQVRLEVAFYPKCATDLLAVGQPYLYKDVNNRIQFSGAYTGGKSRFYVQSAGLTALNATYNVGWTSPAYADMVLASVPLVRMYFECGGGAQNQIWVKNGSAAVERVMNEAATPAFAAGTYKLFGDTTSVACHVTRVGVLKDGIRPDWVV